MLKLMLQKKWLAIYQKRNYFDKMQINDEGITIFERKVPIDYKRSHVVMEVPKKFVD